MYGTAAVTDGWISLACLSESGSLVEPAPARMLFTLNTVTRGAPDLVLQSRGDHMCQNMRS